MTIIESGKDIYSFPDFFFELFCVLTLGYSLIFDEKKTTDQPVIKDSNSVYVDRPANMQISDSVMIYRDQTASVL